MLWPNVEMEILDVIYDMMHARFQASHSLTTLLISTFAVLVDVVLDVIAVSAVFLLVLGRTGAGSCCLRCADMENAQA